MATQQVNERLAALTAAGTSIWLDQIKRGLISTGELQRLVEEDSLRGVTSNPTIFNAGDPRLRRLRRAARRARPRGPGRPRDLPGARDPRHPGRLRRAARRLRRERRQGRLRVLRGRSRPRLRHRPHDGAGARVLGARRPPQPDDQDPGHHGGHARDRGDDLRGAQHQRHAALRRRGVRAGGRGLHPRPRAPPRGGQVASTSTRSRRSSSRAWTPRSTSAWRAPATTTCSGKAGIANARAAYQRYEEIFLGERFAALRERRRRRAAPAVGLDRRQEPGLPRRRCTSRSSSGPNTVNTMPMATLLATGDHAEIRGDDRRGGPGAGAEGAGRRRHRHGRRHRPAAARGRRQVRRADGEAAGGHRLQARGDRHPAPAVDRRLAARRASSRAVAARVKQAAQDDVARRIWRKDDTLWGPAGQAEVANRLGWLTVAEQMREELDDLQAFAEERARRGRQGRACCSAWAARRWRPRSSAARSASRAGWPSLHVLDSTDAGAVRSVQAAIDLDHALFLVSTKSGGTIETLSLFKHFWSLRPDGQRVRRHHRPGLGPREARERARLPAHLPQRPRHRRALQRAVVLRPRAGGAHGRRRGRAAGRRRRRRAELPELRVRRRVERAVARAGVGRAGRRPAATS